MVAQIDRIVLGHQLGRGLHVGVRQLVTVAHQRGELADDAFDPIRPGRLALHQQIVPLRTDSDVEQRFEVLEILVVRAEQRFDPLFGDGDALHQPLRYLLSLQ